MKTHIEMLIQGQLTEVPVAVQYTYHDMGPLSSVVELRDVRVWGSCSDLMPILTRQQKIHLCDMARLHMDMVSA